MLSRLLIVLFGPWFASFALDGQITGGGETGEKPQSKAWFAHQTWWTCLSGKIYQLNGSLFSEVQTISSPDLADAKWDGTHLYLLTSALESSRAAFFKFSFDAVSGRYSLLPGFPVSLPLGGSTETISFDIDGSGIIWASYETGGEIKVIWTTDTEHKTWETSGFVVGLGVKSDDISAVATLSTGEVGVLWSNQNDKLFHFRAHKPGDSGHVWGADEIANQGFSSDDHINLAVTHDGRFYAAVKTSHYKATHLLLERSAAGQWKTYPVIPKDGTRPGLMYNREKDEVLYYFQTREGVSPVILFREPAANILLQTPDTIINQSDARNVSGTKQILDSKSGALILAQKTRNPSATYFHHFPLDPGPGTFLPNLRVPVHKKGAFRVFPNPFSQGVRVSWQGNRHPGVNTQIVDLLGRVVFKPGKTQKNFFWTPGNRSKGPFFVRMGGQRVSDPLFYLP